MSSRTIGIATITGVLLAGTVASGHAQSRAGWRTDFSKHAVPLEEIVAGGPPKDGIPAIDRPRFVTASAANRWLSGTEPVMVVRIGDDARAYPYRILIWHEIVNDVVGDRPIRIGTDAVVVFWAPGTSSALDASTVAAGRDVGATGVFSRDVAGRTLTFAALMRAQALTRPKRSPPPFSRPMRLDLSNRVGHSQERC